MSYDIYLNDPVTGGIIELDEPHQMRGGNYAVGGTTEAWLNVTYNYAKHYYRVMGEGHQDHLRHDGRRVHSRAQGCH